MRKVGVFARFMAFFCLSMSCSMISLLRVPAVLENVERVHRDGNVVRWGNSSRKRWEERPLMRLAMSMGKVLFVLIVHVGTLPHINKEHQ